MSNNSTDIIYCRWCRKYHAVLDYWCPRNVLAGTLDFIRWALAHSFDWYLKGAAIFMLLAFAWAMITMAYRQ